MKIKLNKKLITIVLAISLVGSIVACGSTKEDSTYNETKPSAESNQTDTDAETSATKSE